MRIIYPGQSYEEALVLANCARLDNRREKLCLKALTKISKGGPLAQYVTQTRASEHSYLISYPLFELYFAHQRSHA